MIYEWNGKKAKANLRKHGVSFEQAATVFLDPLALTLPDPHHSSDEEREITIGHSTSHPGRIRVALPAREAHPNHQRAEGDQRRAQAI